MIIHTLTALRRMPNYRSLEEADDAAIGAFCMTLAASQRANAPYLKLPICLAGLTDCQPANFTLPAVRHRGGIVGQIEVTLRSLDKADATPRPLEELLRESDQTEDEGRPLPRQRINRVARDILNIFRSERVSGLDPRSLGASLRGPMLLVARSRGRYDAFAFGAVVADLIGAMAVKRGGSVRLTAHSAWTGDRKIGSWFAEATHSDMPAPTFEEGPMVSASFGSSSSGVSARRFAAIAQSGALQEIHRTQEYDPATGEYRTTTTSVRAPADRVDLPKPP